MVLVFNKEQDLVRILNLSTVAWDVSFWVLPWKPRTVRLKNVQVCRNEMFYNKQFVHDRLSNGLVSSHLCKARPVSIGACNQHVVI